MKKKMPTLDEFEENMKNCPLHKLRSKQFKAGMIAGHIETINMINGILYDKKYKTNAEKTTAKKV